MNTILFFQATTLKCWREKLSGVYQRAAEVGWNVQVIDSQTKARGIREALRAWDPIGCIVERSFSLGREPMMTFGKIPTVYLDQNPHTASPSCRLLSNAADATVEPVVREFAEAKIASCAYVPYFTNVFWSRERGESFARACRRLRMPFYAFRWPSKKLADCQTSLMEFLRSLPKPCGILTANDTIAQRLYACIGMTDLRIGYDILIIGIDNDELICENLNPPLSSVRPDFTAAGYNVAKLLGEVIAGMHAKGIRLSYGGATLVRRASSRQFIVRTPRIDKALAYIDAHAFDPDISSIPVAMEMGCTRRHADTCFRKSLGRTILEEVQRIRLERAYQLLANPAQEIGAIANLVGYKSDSFFKRLFKRQTGMTMRAYRNSHRSKHRQSSEAWTDGY